MRNEEDKRLLEMMEEEIRNEFEAGRVELRQNAKLQIESLQTENRKSYDKNRKPPHKYAVHDLVAIQRTQFG